MFCSVQKKEYFCGLKQNIENATAAKEMAKNAISAATLESKL